MTNDVPEGHNDAAKPPMTNDRERSDQMTREAAMTPAYALVLILFCGGCGERARNGDKAPVLPSPPKVDRVCAEDVPKIHLNWMGHWQYADMRGALVREIARDFEFEHPEIELNLKFPMEIMGERSRSKTAALIADMIRSGKLDWDIVWLDDVIYRLVAEELDDQNWGPKHLVDYEDVPGFVESQKEFIIKDPV